jgi:hypothetical protein
MEDTPIKLARELRQVTNRLVYFQDNDEYSHIDKFQEVTSWISEMCNKLILLKGNTLEEEAEICLSVLAGYFATIRDERNIKKVLDRSYKVLPDLTPSLLKCSLLVYCYGETYDETFSDEAKQIIDTWINRDLTEEEKRTKQLLSDLEYNEIINNKE